MSQLKIEADTFKAGSSGTIRLSLTEPVGAYDLVVRLPDLYYLGETELEGQFTKHKIIRQPPAVFRIVGVGVGGQEIARIGVEGARVGTGQIRIDVNEITSPDAKRYEFPNTVYQAVEVTLEDELSVGDYPPAKDLDNDGLYEDVNGDGTFNVLDVAALLQNYDDIGYRQEFDFNNDGKINILDVSALLDRL